jgi:hypothetical protein
MFSIRAQLGVALSLATVAVALSASACGSDTTGPIVNGDLLQLTGTQLAALDSTGGVIVTANPGNPDLKSLVDSTLDVLSAGIQAKRLALTTNFPTAPLFFVGIHRVFDHASATNSFSTWTLVGFDDPTHLVNLVEVGGFAQAPSSVAPSAVSGTIGNGTGIVNALFLQVGTGGAVTEWHASGGTASFSSDPAATGAACPGFTPTSVVTCTIETMRVHFTATAPAGTGGASAREASLPADVDVPTMRLNYHV